MPDPEISVVIDPQTPQAAAAPSSGAAAPAEADLVIDGRSRKIKLREPTLEQELELMAMVGPERAANGPYMRNVSIVALVDTIDGLPVPMTNFRELRAAMNRLGRDGFFAIMTHLMPAVPDDADGQPGDSAEEITAKN